MAQTDDDLKTPGEKRRDRARERAADKLREEVQRRDEWYGLAQWSEAEVVAFVDDALEEARQLQIQALGFRVNL